MHFSIIMIRKRHHADWCFIDHVMYFWLVMQIMVSERWALTQEVDTLLFLVTTVKTHTGCIVQPASHMTWSTKTATMILPFPDGKKQSISMLLRECEMQRALLGTRPSWGGLLSVVRTRHQPGRSLGLSRSSTVWPVWTLSSVLQPAAKSWRTTVSSQPPDSCRRKEREQGTHWVTALKFQWTARLR